MSMSTHMVLLRDRHDLEYQKKLKVLNACKEAGVEIPLEVDEYFGGYGVDNDPEYPLEIENRGLLKEWNESGSHGYELDIADLPSGVKTIRFYNSW